MNTKKSWAIALACMAALTTVFFSCSSEDEAQSTAVQQSATYLLEQSLDSLDQTIVLALPVSTTRGDKEKDKEKDAKDTINIALQDAFGALEGAAAGATLGAEGGTVAIPIIGTIAGSTAGAILGGLLGGIACSWDAAFGNREIGIEKKWDKGVIEFANVMGTFNTTLSSGSIMQTRTDDTLSLSQPAIIQAQRYARVHNYVLDVMKDSLTDRRSLMYAGYIDNELVDSLKSRYALIGKNSITDLAKHKELPYKTVLTMDRFASTFSKYAESKDNAQTIIGRYLTFIDESTEFSEDERINLLLALSVAWYSYQYWTE